MDTGIFISRKGLALMLIIPTIAGIILGMSAFSSAIGNGIMVPSALGASISSTFKVNIENNSDKVQFLTLRISSQSGGTSQSVSESSVGTVQPHSNYTSGYAHLSGQTGNHGTTTINLCTSRTQCTQLDLNSLSGISELRVRINPDSSISIVK